MAAVGAAVPGFECIHDSLPAPRLTFEQQNLRILAWFGCMLKVLSLSVGTAADGPLAMQRRRKFGARAAARAGRARRPGPVDWANGFRCQIRWAESE